MERKKTMFQYLHDALVKQITSGQLAYGEQLPPLRTLCGLYNVGIRTVRDVIKALAGEGYITTVPGSHVRVGYRARGEGAALAQAELSRGDALYGLMKTMEYVMPHIYAGAAGACGSALLEACRRDVAGIDGMDTKDQWRRARIAFQRIVAVYGNGLLDDLYIDIDLSAQVVIVPGFDNPYGEMSVGAEAGLNRLFDRLAAGDGDGAGAIIRGMYHDAAQSVSAYHDALRAAYPAAEQAPYRWDAAKGRSRTYMEVTRDIIRRICAGEFPDGSELPGSARLCAEYRISPYTAFHAMEALERIQLVEKGEGRRRYVITCARASAKVMFADGPTPVADAVTFLNAVHILSLISAGAAELGYDYLTEDDVAALSARIGARERMRLSDGILMALIRAQPYQPLKAIGAELLSLAEWGCYFVFALQREQALFLTVQQKCAQALQAWRAGDRAAFAGAVRDIYGFAYTAIRELLCRAGIPAAGETG